MSSRPRRSSQPKRRRQPHVATPDQLLRELINKNFISDSDLRELNQLLSSRRGHEPVAKLEHVVLDRFKAVVISHADGKDRALPTGVLDLLSECTTYRNLSNGSLFARAANWSAKIQRLQTIDKGIKVAEVELTPLVLRQRTVKSKKEPNGTILVYNPEVFGRVAVEVYFKLDLRTPEEEHDQIQILKDTLDWRLRDLFKIGKSDVAIMPPGNYLGVLELPLDTLHEQLGEIRRLLGEAQDKNLNVQDFRMHLVDLSRESSEGLKIEDNYNAWYPQGSELIPFARYGHSSPDAARSPKDYWSDVPMPVQAKHIILVGGPRTGKTFLVATVAAAFRRKSYRVIFATYKNMGSRKAAADAGKNSDSVNQAKECNNLAASLLELGEATLAVLRPCDVKAFLERGTPGIGYIELGIDFTGSDLLNTINAAQDGMAKKILVCYDEVYNYLPYDPGLIAKINADAMVVGSRNIWVCLIDQQLARIIGNEVDPKPFRDPLMPPLRDGANSTSAYSDEVHWTQAKEILKPISKHLKTFSRCCTIVASNLQLDDVQRPAFEQLCATKEDAVAWEVDFSDVQQNGDASRGKFVLFPTTGSGNKYPLVGEVAKSTKMSEKVEESPVAFGELKLTRERFFPK